MHRLRLAPVLVLLALQLVLPTQASAWVSDGQPTYRPGSNIRYWIASMPAQQRVNAARAIQAWNASGGRFRLMASTRALAQVRIMSPFAARRCRGDAASRSVNGRRVLSTITWNRCSDPLEERGLLAHELGHALGLGHEDRRCATMNSIMASGAGFECDVIVQPWQYYCRLLERDDINGIIRRYGGTPRYPSSPAVCARGVAPLSAGSVTVTYDPATQDAIASWTNPSGSTATAVRVVWKRDTCPTSATDGFGRAELGATPGAASAILDQLPVPGTFCVLVQPVDVYGQPPTTASTAMITA